MLPNVKLGSGNNLKTENKQKKTLISFQQTYFIIILF